MSQYQVPMQRLGQLAEDGMNWWLRLTSPPEPPMNAKLREREDVRQAKLVSVLMLLLVLLVPIVLPIALFSGDFPVLIAMAVGLGTYAFVLWLNRQGRVSTVGGILVGVSILTYVLSQVYTPGGLRVGDLPDFDLLVQSELLAVALLPARSVFAVAALNSLLIWGTITFQRHAPDLTRFLLTDRYAAIGRPIALQIIVAVVSYLLVRSVTVAIARADRAEIIAALEHEKSEQEMRTTERLFLLEGTVQAIARAQQQVSEGRPTSVIVLPPDDVLWPIAEGQALIQQYVRSLQREREEQRVTVDQIVAALRESIASGRPLRIPGDGEGARSDLLHALADYAQQYGPHQLP